MLQLRAYDYTRSHALGSNSTYVARGTCVSDETTSLHITAYSIYYKLPNQYCLSTTVLLYRWLCLKHGVHQCTFFSKEYKNVLHVKGSRVCEEDNMLCLLYDNFTPACQLLYEHLR